VLASQIIEEQRSFLVLLCGAGNAMPLVQALASYERKLGRARVLIAEDDFLIAMQTQEALSAAGLEVVGVAVTAEEVLDLARQERPALVVMDIRLAGRRDGIEAARELFRQFNVRCIFATANDDLHTRERAEYFAPFGWLTKPYTMASLLTSVADALDELGRGAPPD
jgi:DNA-binding NarL/FixJ family response regulator